MSPETLQKLYRDLYLIRRTEERIAELYPQQEMRCPVHLCIGQEAPPVGICHCLEQSDYVFGNHRSHGHYIAKGGNLSALIAEFYGREMGCSMGKGGSMHLIDLSVGFLGAAPILGATIALATGAAFASKMRGEQRVTVAFFGDGAVEEGIFYESVNFAALHKLPIVMVCENNQLSMQSLMHVRQPAGRKIYEMVKAIGVQSCEGDGNDVLDVVRLGQNAVAQARAGSGPVFLELHTYRWREHCGPANDYNMGYRTQDEVEYWVKNGDALARLKNHMTENGAWNDSLLTAQLKQIDEQIEKAIQLARSSPYPGQEWLWRDEYAPDRQAGVAVPTPTQILETAA